MRITEKRLRSVIRNVISEMRDADIDQESFHDYGEYKGTSLAEDIASFLRKASSAKDFVYVDLSHLCERLAEMCGGRGPGDEYVEAIFTILHPYSDNSRRVEAGAHALGKGKISDIDSGIFVQLNIANPMGVAKEIVAQCSRSVDATHDFNLRNQ